MLWLYCLSSVVITPLLIYRSCVDYLLSRSTYLLFFIVLNCVALVVYLYFSVYAVNAWVLPAAERWNNSNRCLVVRPTDENDKNEPPFERDANNSECQVPV